MFHFQYNECLKFCEILWIDLKAIKPLLECKYFFFLQFEDWHKQIWTHSATEVTYDYVWMWMKLFSYESHTWTAFTSLFLDVQEVLESSTAKLICNDCSFSVGFIPQDASSSALGSTVSRWSLWASGWGTVIRSHLCHHFDDVTPSLNDYS